MGVEKGEAKMTWMVKPGYLYVLTHPSDPNLYKIGVTVKAVEKRLAEHNSQLDKAAGMYVKETGQMWEIKTVIEVPDPYWAERAFWMSTPFPDIPFLGGVEVLRMDWQMVEKGLEAAKEAGVRLRNISTSQIRQERKKDNFDKMVKELEGTGIEFVNGYHGRIRRTEFKCSKGHNFIKSAGQVAYYKVCPICVDWWRYNPRAKKYTQ